MEMVLLGVKRVAITWQKVIFVFNFYFILYIKFCFLGPSNLNKDGVDTRGSQESGDGVAKSKIFFYSKFVFI
jgi:hypothetical protein